MYVQTLLLNHDNSRVQAREECARTITKPHVHLQIARCPSYKLRTQEHAACKQDRLSGDRSQKVGEPPLLFLTTCHLLIQHRINNYSRSTKWEYFIVPFPTLKAFFTNYRHSKRQQKQTNKQTDYKLLQQVAKNHDLLLHNHHFP